MRYYICPDKCPCICKEKIKHKKNELCDIKIAWCPKCVPYKKKARVKQ